MFAVLVMAGMLATMVPSRAVAAAATPAPSSAPFTLVTPAPRPGAHPSPLPTAAPVPTPIVNAIDGVTLGDTRDTVRKSFGKPLEVDPVSVGELVVFGTDGGNARLAVIFASDAAMSITFSASDGKKSTFADPYGVSLGMTVDQLTSLRGQPLTVANNGNRVYGDPAGIRWVYGFDSGQITDINVSQPAHSSATPIPSSIDTSNGRDGSAIERAIIVIASSTGAGTDLEYRYVKGLSCALGGAWNVVTQTTLPIGGRWIDEFDMTCSSDKTTRKLYFDVTAYAAR